MKLLNEDRLAKLQGRLVEEKREIERHFDLEEKENALSGATGELSSYDNHPADLGTETFERERDQAVDDAFGERLDEIEGALDRMAKGTYGRCVVCGEQIPYERLEAIPSAPTCLKDTPQVGDPAGRPVEEQTMQQTVDKFDDAGSWESVERYGSSDSPVESNQPDVDARAL
ncbi:conjugal transfer protein TraR [Cohnella endophytica]|uniref:Conjugal transfer protein TraR n=1 Tax=Cohnella endophytica TaxID=2419778 RepID=A0A494XGW6_9BACL|nr:TraR/DksA C4-type zinc finger protein [Cohnella endophytica]RKP49987.1 conjugal transfer protein TraR [Cohnella endophytica]